MATSASGNLRPGENAAQGLDSYKGSYAHAHQLPAVLKSTKHFITYDRSSVHKPPQAQSTLSAASSPAGSTAVRTGSTGAAHAPSRLQHRGRRRIDRLYADLPQLQQEEEDDEDFEDDRSLSRYGAETNRWLLFSGVFSLIITIFIVNFSTLPHQAHARKQMELIMSRLTLIAEQLEAAPPHMRTNGPEAIASLLQAYNVSAWEPPPPPTFAMEIRDDYAPALWYTSLMLTLMGTMVVLTMKQWLMTCTFSTWPSFYDPDPEDSLQDAERMRIRRPSAQKKAELRRTKKETLRRTERVKGAVPLLMYPALGIFLCGVLAKIGSLMWIGHA